MFLCTANLMNIPPSILVIKWLMFQLAKSHMQWSKWRYRFTLTHVLWFWYYVSVPNHWSNGRKCIQLLELFYESPIPSHSFMEMSNKSPIYKKNNSNWSLRLGCEKNWICILISAIGQNYQCDSCIHASDSQYMWYMQERQQEK